MKKKFIMLALAAVGFCGVPQMQAQFNLGRAAKAAASAAKAVTLNDDQMTQYVKEYIDWMDTHNEVAAPDSPYTQRLNALTEGLTDVDGTPLNFKVYLVIDVNAFACADGSVRVFSSLMDIMSDEELLGVIGHEVGHVGLHHSRKAFKNALLTSALKDAVGSANSKVGALTDSQLGSLGEALVTSKYSRKQEEEADDYGYEFLKSKGKDPAAMAAAFRKLQELEGEQKAKSNKLNQLFSSHPELDKRIERMDKKLKAEKK